MSGRSVEMLQQIGYALAGIITIFLTVSIIIMAILMLKNIKTVMLKSWSQWLKRRNANKLRSKRDKEDEIDFFSNKSSQSVCADEEAPQDQLITLRQFSPKVPIVQNQSLNESERKLVSRDSRESVVNDPLLPTPFGGVNLIPLVESLESKPQETEGKEERAPYDLSNNDADDNEEEEVEANAIQAGRIPQNDTFMLATIGDKLNPNATPGLVNEVLNTGSAESASYYQLRPEMAESLHVEDVFNATMRQTKLMPTQKPPEV